MQKCLLGSKELQKNMKYINRITIYICTVFSKLLFKNDLEKILDYIFLDIDNIVMIPDNLIPPLVCAEDHRFFCHPGFDVISIIRAIFCSIFISIQGGSTIDQQLVRTITQEKKICLKRKLKEILLAAALNGFVKKHIIAKSYIYFAYYGWKMNGYDEAIRRIRKYREFDTEQELFLIALLKYPLPQVLTEPRFQKITDRKKMLNIATKRGKNENFRLGESGLWNKS